VTQSVRSTLEVTEGTAIVQFAGELDVDRVVEMRTWLDQAFAAADVARVEVDLGPTEFVDSTALGVLVGARRRADGAGLDFAVTNLASRVERLFAVTGTLTLLTGREL